jgi:hypothetical protein
MRRFLFTVFSVFIFSAGALAQTPGSPGGLVVFETFTSGAATNLTEAVVLAGAMTPQAVLFASSSSRLSRTLGIAIANPSGTAANVTMTLRRGTDGTLNSVKTLTIPARAQVSQFISELFADVAGLPPDFDGSLVVSSDNPVAMVFLRFRGSNFSVVPVTNFASPTAVPSIATGVGGLDAVILPHFATGGSWLTDIVISNTTAVPVTVRMDLFTTTGTPMVASFNGQSGSTFQNLVIPAEGILIEKNSDSGPIRTGYVIVTPVNSPSPQVTATLPANGATGVPLNQVVSATFNKIMDGATLTSSTFTLRQGGASVSGTVSYSGFNASFTPTGNLTAATTYTATVTTGAKDLAGNALSADAVWSFTTGTTTLNPSAPSVTSTVPVNGASGVPTNQILNATFSTPMDPATITAATFTLQQGVTNVPGAVTYSGSVASLDPTSNLAVSTTYTATITTGARDASGTPLAANFVWTFTTGATAAPISPATISLGAAAPYGILGGAGVTNSGPTIINGSLGTSPTGTLTGAPVVTGTTDLANPAAALAKLALTAAFNDAAGRSANSISLPGDLSGLTLAPGLYTNSTSVMLSAGNVTLDAQGDPNATWIFQMGSTLTTFTGTQVVLAGGAKASNIFWQVGSSATLGANSIFKGNILADISISVNTGAVVEGRLLTRTGAVSLLSNIVTLPTP